MTKEPIMETIIKVLSAANVAETNKRQELAAAIGSTMTNWGKHLSENSLRRILFKIIQEARETQDEAESGTRSS